MWKIISVKDKEGNEKTEWYNKLKIDHPDMIGKFVKPQNIYPNNMCICFAWDDDSGKILVTSIVESVKWLKKSLIIKTQNSIYTFLRVSKQFGD